MSLITKDFLLGDIFNDFITSTSPTTLKCDIYEKNGNYHIEMDAPGFNKDDIKIEYKDKYLIISASKEDVREEENVNYIRRERTSGKYERSFHVGNIDVEKIDAEFKDGLLKILLPKKDEDNNKKVIEIN